ncbi:MAG TPA: energy transducer TonB [Candidatus Sulfotelmatobacter sp.]|nr:energy transducer TonB [Candidatus Sulfotelmatobacter sp.]
MKRRTAVLFALLLLSILLGAPLARAGDDVEDQLKSDYADKVLTLRHFYKGNHLHFQSDGALVGFAEVGPWTLDGQVSVKRIRVHDRTVQIRGRRVCLVFDAKGKPPRDVLTSLAESNAKDRDKLAEPFRANDVEIEIEFASERPDLDQVLSAMNAVFLKSGESMRDFVPDFWQDYFDQVEGQPKTVRHSSDPVYTFKRGEVSAPRVTHQPNPEFSEEARRAKYQGTTVLSLVVDESGSTRDIEVVNPLGLGLDEKAVGAVSTWKFEPGKKDGKPVPVRIAVETDFHLY